jgi:AcrR family transcriptional regulator
MRHQVGVKPNCDRLRSAATNGDPTRPGDPRARAAGTQRDRTRRALLDAAGATPGSRGWARTRTEDTAAGVSAATAYNHFPCEHTLIGRVIEPLARPPVARARRDPTRGRPVVDAPEDRVRAPARPTPATRSTRRPTSWAAPR